MLVKHPSFRLDCCEILSIAVAFGVAALALPLLFLCGLLGLLGSLLFLLLALALGLLLGVFLVVIGLLALLVLDLLLCASWWDGRSSGNISSRSDLGDGSILNVVPVEVLVLGIPFGWGLLVGTTEFLFKLADVVENEVQYIRRACRPPSSSSSRWQRGPFPSPWVQIALHDDTLDLGNNAMVARRHLNSRHLGVGKSNSLTLGGHQNDLLVNLNALLES